MPDISMCLSTTCPSRARCYRNEASGTRPTAHWQSWIAFDARRGDADRCDNFWERGTDGAHPDAAETRDEGSQA